MGKRIVWNFLSTEWHSSLLRVLLVGLLRRFRMDRRYPFATNYLYLVSTTKKRILFFFFRSLLLPPVLLPLPSIIHLFAVLLPSSSSSSSESLLFHKLFASLKGRKILFETWKVLKKKGGNFFVKLNNSDEKWEWINEWMELMFEIKKWL